MGTNETGKSRQPLYKKLIGLGIMAAVAIYCIPELQETARACIESLREEWRKKNER